MVTWPQMRARFKQERKARPGLTQVALARSSGLDQSAISKIESDPKYTPLVDTFVAAIHGLGVTAAEFFATLEGVPITRRGPARTLTMPTEARPPALSADEFQAILLGLSILQDVAERHDARIRREKRRAR